MYDTLDPRKAGDMAIVSIQAQHQSNCDSYLVPQPQVLVAGAGINRQRKRAAIIIKCGPKSYEFINGRGGEGGKGHVPRVPPPPIPPGSAAGGSPSTAVSVGSGAETRYLIYPTHTLRRSGYVYIYHCLYIETYSVTFTGERYKKYLSAKAGALTCKRKVIICPAK